MAICVAESNVELMLALGLGRRRGCGARVEDRCARRRRVGRWHLDLDPRYIIPGETGLQTLEEVEGGERHRRVKPPAVQYISDEVVQPQGSGGRDGCRGKGGVRTRKKV
jgi:hypothetical protein